MNFKSEIETYKFIMDIETYVFESTQVPFSNKVLVDKDVMYDYLDRLRSRLPKEMKECKRIIEKRQSAENNNEDTKDNIISPLPVEQKLSNSNEKEILESAKRLQDTQKECEKMLKEAQERAQLIMQNAYNRAEQMLVLLEDQVEKNLSEVKDGRGQIADVINKMRK